MLAGNINELMWIWADTLPKDQDPRFNDKQELYNMIDAIEVGDAPWKSFSVSFAGDMAEDDTTPWKHANYEVWYHDPRAVLHNPLKNTNFAEEMDFAPKEVRNENDKHRYTDFMSGD